MAKSSFEEHMRIVDGSHTKTASASNVSMSLLDKLAAEMAGGVDSMAQTAIPAAATTLEANPGTVAATDMIAVPQTQIAGGAEEEKLKGETPAATKPSVMTISAGDGKPVNILTMNKMPEAAAEAVKEAEEIGRTMARSYVAEMQKIAIDSQFSEAVGILKEAGLLDGYNLNVEVEKTASSQESALEKIANVQPLTKEDMVKAAQEYVELEKQAADADAYGREQAHEFVKEASDADSFGREQAHEYFEGLVKQAEEEVEEEEKEEEDEKKEEESEKKSSDRSVEAAVKTLVEAGIIEG